jgi:hypothetical protein
MCVLRFEHETPITNTELYCICFVVALKPEFSMKDTLKNSFLPHGEYTTAAYKEFQIMAG